MWKIFIEYDDKSKVTLTGRGKDISYHLAVRYHRLYVNNKKCTAIYQQYPKKEHPSMSLLEKIEELEQQLEQQGVEAYEERLKKEIPTPLHQYQGEPVK